jgi:ribosomal protein L27
MLKIGCSSSPIKRAVGSTRNGRDQAKRLWRKRATASFVQAATCWCASAGTPYHPGVKWHWAATTPVCPQTASQVERLVKDRKQVSILRRSRSKMGKLRATNARRSGPFFDTYHVRGGGNASIRGNRKITVKAGNGGNGAVAFTGKLRGRRRPPTRVRPGGDILLQVDRHMSTQMDFRYKRKYARATHGRTGQALIRKGRADLVIKGRARGAGRRHQKINCDMSSGPSHCAGPGGQRRLGQQDFATPTRQCPGLPRRGSPARSARCYRAQAAGRTWGWWFPNVGKSRCSP